MTSNARIELNISDGTRRPIPGNAGVWVTLIAFRMGTHKIIYQEKRSGPRHVFDVEYLDADDRFSVVINPDNYTGTGYGIFPASPDKPARVGLMALPKVRRFNFGLADWATLQSAEPKLFDILNFSETGGVDTEKRYSELMKEQPEALAAILNIMTAIKDMRWKVIGRPLEYFKGLFWEDRKVNMQPDRFYAWADPELLVKVREAAKRKDFETSPPGPHHGATVTYKQLHFMTANVQLSFHENDKLNVGGKQYVKVELDIDYYRDKFAHLLLEVILNELKGDTDPVKVYVLRWSEGQWAGVPFNPPFTITA